MDYCDVLSALILTAPIHCTLSEIKEHPVMFSSSEIHKWFHDSLQEEEQIKHAVIMNVQFDWHKRHTAQNVIC